MVPRGGPAIWNIRGKGIAIEVHRKSKYPRTWCPTHDPIGSPTTSGKNHLAKTQLSLQKCGQNLTQSFERPPQGGFRTSNFLDNGWIMER